MHYTLKVVRKQRKNVSNYYSWITIFRISWIKDGIHFRDTEKDVGTMRMENSVVNYNSSIIDENQLS